MTQQLISNPVDEIDYIGRMLATNPAKVWMTETLTEWGATLRAVAKQLDVTAAPEPTQRTEHIAFRVTPEEKVKLHQCADNLRVKVGQYIRSRLFRTE